jgi:hypothetical protein
MGYTLLGGLIPFSLGAGLLAFYFVTSPSRKKSGVDL